MAESGSARFRREIEEVYDPGPAHEVQLDQICAAMDLLDELAALVATEGLTVTGGNGQVVVHPAVSELRRQREALAKLLLQLGIGDEPQAGKASRAATALNQKRWKKAT